jgi:hypothetical protein
MVRRIAPNVELLGPLEAAYCCSEHEAGRYGSEWPAGVTDSWVSDQMSVSASCRSDCSNGGIDGGGAEIPVSGWVGPSADPLALGNQHRQQLVGCLNCFG